MVRTVFYALLAMPFLAACASVQPPARVTPQQSAAIQETCSKVMRIHKGFAEFDGCVSDLTDTVSAEMHYGRAVGAYRVCAQSGAVRGTPAFNRCVLDTEGTQTASSAPGGALALNVADVKAADSNPDSFFTASFDVRHRREEYACAQIGLAPESGSFTSCVNNLDIDLFNIGHPLG